jgi:DNA-binding GntR family transcriptional regulator
MLSAMHVDAASDEPAGKPERRALADWTLARLHEMVFSGELRPGDALIEMDLTQRLSVSRSPLRDALKQLEHSGLVEVDAVNGRRILRPFLAADVAELYDIRRELEALVVARAAEDPSAAVVAALGQRLRAMEAAVDEPIEIWIASDFAFHAQLSESSGARRLPHLLRGIWVQHQALLRRMALVGSYPSTKSERLDVIEDHRRILHGISSRAPVEAQRAMRHHLNRRREIVMRALHERGDAGV